MKEDERRKKESVVEKKVMQKQNIEAFVESKRRWEEREKERVRREEAKIEEFLGKKEAWKQTQSAAELEKKKKKSQVIA